MLALYHVFLLTCLQFPFFLIVRLPHAQTHSKTHNTWHQHHEHTARAHTHINTTTTSTTTHKQCACVPPSCTYAMITWRIIANMARWYTNCRHWIPTDQVCVGNELCTTWLASCGTSPEQSCQFFWKNWDGVGGWVFTDLFEKARN